MPSHQTLINIYITLREKLARSVTKLVPPKEVEDIVQEAYVRICQIKNSDNIDSPKPFLFKMVRNLALDYRKRAESRVTDGIDNIDQLAVDESQCERDEMFEQAASSEKFGRFCEAVRVLPVQSRRAFVLKKVYGYSQKEIAREMNISENTVEKHIALGIKRCTFYMQQYHYTDRSKPMNVKKGKTSKRFSHAGDANHE